MLACRLHALVSLLILNLCVLQTEAKHGEISMRQDATSTDDSSVTWIFPSESSTSAFNSVDTLDAAWSSSLQQPTLVLWCRQDAAKVFKTSMPLYREMRLAQILLTVIRMDCRCHCIWKSVGPTQLVAIVLLHVSPPTIGQW